MAPDATVLSHKKERRGSNQNRGGGDRSQERGFTKKKKKERKHPQSQTAATLEPRFVDRAVGRGSLKKQKVCTGKAHGLITNGKTSPALDKQRGATAPRTRKQG